MKILNEKPPIYERAAELFGLKENDVVYFTYGDTIYNPSGAPISADLIVHEETHGEQQEHHPTVAAIWWERHLHDPEFRVEQEAEAYGAQYRWLCRQHRDKNKRARMLHILGQQLSGPMYGRAVGLAEAKEKIRTYAENIFPDE